MMTKNPPAELYTSYRLSGGPSKIGRFLRRFIRSVRNSRLGPPVSNPSSQDPASSENLMKMSLSSEYELRQNPQTAPSHTSDLDILNLLTFLRSIASAKFAIISEACMLVGLEKSEKLTLDCKNILKA